jgi:hypothetical protein
MGPMALRTTKTVFRARSAATTSESGEPWTASPPSVAIPRTMREADWARQAAGSSPPVAA